MAHAQGMMDNKGYRHKLGICNTSCFILQQWLTERTSKLHNTYTACLVSAKLHNTVTELGTVDTATTVTELSTVDTATTVMINVLTPGG